MIQHWAIWCRFLGSVLLAAGMTFSALADNSKTKSGINNELLERITEQVAQKTADKILKKITPDSTNAAVGSANPSVLEEPTKTTGKPTKSRDKLIGIGSGSVGGNYYVLGELVGGVVSHPVGSLPCGQGGTCGVPNLQIQNITSAGSMANLNALKNGKITMGFVQSDMAYWAYTGMGAFDKKMTELRAIASLYPEAIHIVVRKDLRINDVSELQGKRVSLGAKNSGTLSQARLVLDAYKLSEDSFQVSYLNNQQSIEKLKSEDLDAMFFTVGAPAPALTQLFTENDEFTLLSLNDAAQKEIFRQGHYFSSHTIAAETYPKVGTTSTISVYALWLCTADTDETLVYQMTKALWSDSARQLLESSYIGHTINVDNSLKGIGIPLHDGAKKYYDEIGKRY